MFRLRKIIPTLNSSNQAQTAMEYMLLLSTVTIITLLAFNGKYLGRVHNAANLYFDRVAVGIYGEGSACGDKHCDTGIEDVVGKAFCPTDCTGIPIPTAGDCAPTPSAQSGPCTINIPSTVKDGTSVGGSCTPFGCSGSYKFQCINGELRSILAVQCNSSAGLGAFCAPASMFHSGPQCSGIVNFSHADNGAKATGSCPSGCTGGPIEITCNDGDFVAGSRVETSPCVPGTPTGGASCPREIKVWDKDGCAGNVVLNDPNISVPDGQDVQANCPVGPGCISGSIGATCNNGTFDNLREIQRCSVVSSLDCPARIMVPTGTCQKPISVPSLNNGQGVYEVNCPSGCLGILTAIECVNGTPAITGVCDLP